EVLAELSFESLFVRESLHRRRCSSLLLTHRIAWWSRSIDMRDASTIGAHLITLISKCSIRLSRGDSKMGRGATRMRRRHMRVLTHLRSSKETSVFLMTSMAPTPLTEMKRREGSLLE